jgi:UDP-glucose 4-epimerase
MNVLVTGGAGFIGSHVVDRLVADGHAVTVVDDLSSGVREQVHAAATLCVCDIRSPDLHAIVLRARPQAVVHLAAQAAVPRSLAEPQFDAAVNILGTINLLEAARDAGVGRMVYVSTGGAAYGDAETLPTPEDHPARALSPYGVSKVTAERYLECWTALTAMTGLSLRLANVYGPRQRAEGEAGVVAIFTRSLLGGERCRIYGDGEQTRDYVYVADVADAVSAALGRPAAGVVNIATARETSVNALFRRLCAIVGVSPEPEYLPARPGDVRRSALDNARARAVLGWTPRTSLEQGLVATVESVRARHAAPRP